MKVFSILAFSILVGFLSSSATHSAQLEPDEPQSRKLVCIIEKVAGVTISGKTKEPTAKAIRFDERHNHFVLTIKPIVRAQDQRDFCLSSLSHWTPILAEKGTFDPSDHPGSKGDKFYDYRANLGPNCFASSEAKLKYFDRDHENSLFSYDFLTTEFESLPGNWLKIYADKFEAGESLDAGPVVFSGSCSPIE